MAFTDTEQQSMIAEIATHQATVGLASIPVEFSLTSDPIVYNDGSYEAGKPYVVITSKAVADNAIVHGTAIIIDSITWYVVGIDKKRSGFLHLSLSRTHE